MRFTVAHPADALALLAAVAVVLCTACGVAFGVAVVWGGV